MVSVIKRLFAGRNNKEAEVRFVGLTMVKRMVTKKEQWANVRLVTRRIEMTEVVHFVSDTQRAYNKVVPKSHGHTILLRLCIPNNCFHFPTKLTNYRRIR